MASASITIRMDEKLKKQAEALFADLGMNMTTAFTVFAKAAVRQQKIPFELAVDPFYSDANMERLRRGIAALNAGEGIEHELIEVEDE
jgi:DNA-damage-inducible protein J